MERWNYPDGNISYLVDGRSAESRREVKWRIQSHSSLIQRLALENDMKGHRGCVNSIAWNSKGSLLISGSDDTRMNIWSYNDRGLLYSIETGHSANIFCTKFIPETSDELIVSGAGDAEVRVFNLSRLGRKRPQDIAIEPVASYKCHSRRVKKLAVEAGNPNVIWSASEDGTLRQHDLREASSCMPPGSLNHECRNVLLDLRSGAKKSLADSPKQILALKTCDISPTRPHQLLVGGSDAFARLYDRRMLPPLSSSQMKMKPPPCVNYFCPLHLSERRRSSLHLTHVAFSPNGGEVLLSYSGEHAYLMDVDHDEQSRVKYTAYDTSRYLYPSPYLGGKELLSVSSLSPSSDTTRRNGNLHQIGMYKKLIKTAAKTLEESTDITCGVEVEGSAGICQGIEACNEVLDGTGPDVGSALRHDCLCIRAALLLKRKWKNDVHMAIRDCNDARRMDLSSFKAHYYMTEALLQLGKHKEASEYADAAGNLVPPNCETTDMISSIKTHLTAAEAEKAKKDTDGNARGEVHHGRFRSLSNVLIRAELNSPSESYHEREDSDYEEEMEVDFETTVSGEESHDAEANVVRGSLNLRFHQRDDSSRESCTNDSQGSPSSCYHNENYAHKTEIAIDMKRRYVGHCNLGTDIKQASFLGQRGEFVASGSDDGRWFIWEKSSGRLVKMFSGDDSVVNCIQCHPMDCVVATSGIDNTIKLWTPHAEVPSLVAGGVAGPETADIWSAIEINQRKLCRNWETILPFQFFERFRMNGFTEGTLHPFECAQT